ncbi:MAG TPA: phage holin family protein [Candidatus Binatia bacterium]|nr:phage holin family protein [Candidatus Binatia bacterium]
MSRSAPPSARDALRELLADATRFARAEVNLVKAEGVRVGKRAAIAAGLLAAAALWLFLLLVFLLGAGATAIGGVVGAPWLGWLCIAGLCLLLAAALGFAGYRILRRAIGEGKQLGAIMKEDLEWVRELPKQSANGS